MKSNLLRGVGIALVTCLIPLAVQAQRAQKKNPLDEEPVSADHCDAAGIHCFFGKAAGCSVTCGDGNFATCIGARCILGFPSSAECACGPGGMA